MSNPTPASASTPMTDLCVPGFDGQRQPGFRAYFVEVYCARCGEPEWRCVGHFAPARAIVRVMDRRCYG
jgi:hypothetical protein